MLDQQKSGSPETASGNAPRADVLHVLKAILKKRTGHEGEDWTEETPLKDTGLDSFDAIECIFELEEHYKVDIDFNANSPETKLETIGDFVDMASRAIIAGR
jgi:acyl carrier protein